jgi:Ca2+/H+ antiporter
MLDKIFMVLLLAVPAVAVGDFLHFPPSVMMTLACLGILPIAKYMGQATEQLSHKTGPQWGGLITATFGNMCELVIALMALRAGLIDVVKASITGSIIGNILLVLGASMFFGGLRHETQKFNAKSAGHAATMLLIVAGALMLPAAVHHIPNVDTALVDGKISLVISLVLILLYFGGMYFSLKTHRHQFTPVAAAEKSKHEAEVEHEATWSPLKSIAVLCGATLTVVFSATTWLSTSSTSRTRWACLPCSSV